VIKKPLVLVVGSTGNLGAVVMRVLQKMEVEVQPVIKQVGLDPEFVIIPFKGIFSSNNRLPDVIVNLSNSYFPSPSQEEREKMRESILGVAVAIANSASVWRASIISFSTYFQYAPREHSPWSAYSSLKTQAQSILINESMKSDVSLSDFVLYDTYGGSRKSKFFDLALESQIRNQVMDASLGEQVVNLSHVEDIAETVAKEIFLLIETREKHEIRISELRSSTTLSLRSLVDEINSVSGKQLAINWGRLPYRKKEVFQLWESGLPTPQIWKPSRDLRSYISMYLNGAIPG
jgi:dTDP-4-dehydrorhamnose reductase